MRKRIGNDKVIRAMAIGISAVLATASPMTVFAAEGDEPKPDDGDNNTASEEATKSKAQEAADSASDSVDKADSSATIVKGDVATNVVGSAETSEDSEFKDLAQAVIDAAGDVENANVENGTPIADAGTAIENTNTQLDAAEAADESSDAAAGKATDAAQDAADIVSDMKTEMEKASKKADEQADAIKNATTIEDANAAYEELEKTANEAEAQFNEKVKEYDAAKAAYDEAKAAVEKYEAEYAAAIANAETNAEAAAAKLEAAKANAEALEKAVATAKDAVDASAATAMEIVKAEDLTRNDGKLDWKNEDKLFVAIMQNYYLPEKLGITDATVTRVQGKDNNEYNYFEAKYIDENGETQVKYFNYKMDNGSKDDIVIFEKREVEIFGDPSKDPDQYEDKDGNVVDVAAGLEDGSVVSVPVEKDKNDYYEVDKNKITKDTIISESSATNSDESDISFANEQVSWQYSEETKELVKTVTADVTIITYTDATFISDQSYATDAERDVAAAAKEAELEETTGKDATINETEETTYTASGTYIPTFTKTVNVNKEYESGRLWGEVDSEKEAKDKALNWAKDEIDDDLGDYYLIGKIKSDLSVSMTEEETETYKIFGKTHTWVTDDSDYLVTGTVTATYAKVTKETVDQSTLGSIWNDLKALFGSGQSTNKKLEAAAKAAIEAEGGIFLSANWDDWSLNKATIRYVAGVKVETDAKQTENEAKEALDDAISTQLKEKGATGVYNPEKNVNAHTTYSYTIDYLEKGTTTTETKTVATETYGNAEQLTGVIIQNKNYKDNQILLTQNDNDYRKFVDDAKDLTAKYERLLEEATKANNDVLAAQDSVTKLEDEIAKLKDRESNSDNLKKLQAKLDLAQAHRDEAEKILNDILDQLTESGTDLTEVTNRLTPSGGGAGGTGGAGGAAAVAATQTGDVLGATRGGGASVEEGDVLGATRAPKTSDSAKGILWMLGMAGSALGATSILAKRKKEEQE